jgi:hypothetical protein
VGARSFLSAGAAVRPVIRLAPNTEKFQDANAPMPMLDFTRHLNGHVPVVDGTNFNQLLRGVDLHLDGNAGATGVMLPGAQGCSVQDVTITGTPPPAFVVAHASHIVAQQWAAGTAASPAAAAPAAATAW